MDDQSPEPELFYRDFKELSSCLQKSGKLSTLSEDFSKLKTDFERIAFVRQLEEVRDTFDLSSVPSIRKSSAASQNLRNEGNKFFKSGKYEEALSLYNDSIAYALNYRDDGSGNNNLALAFSNRSAALFYLKDFSNCLKDIEHAIVSGYAEDLQCKLYDRKGKCHKALKSNTAAQLAFEAAVALLEKSKLDNKKREAFLKELKKNIADCNEENGMKEEDRLLVKLDKAEKALPALCESANSVYTSLASACKVVYTPNQGRFLVANRDIEPGEVVLVEKPYACILLPDQYINHCHHCFRRCMAPMVCLQCPIARYCSATCRDLSWDHYHKHECDSLDIIHRSGVGKFGHLALRTISVSGLEFLLQSRTENLTPAPSTHSKELEGCGPDGRYLAGDYRAIIHLVTHDADRTVADLFRRSTMAVFLLRCLDRAKFFTDVNAGDREDIITYIGALMLSHLQLLPCNAHEIAELELDNSSVASSVPTEIGAGIYSTLSLFNHSCNPTVTRNFYGETCIVRAIKTIRSGQEVSDNYGAVYAVQSRAERRQKLSPQYYFECACEACLTNWPLYPHIAHDKPTFKCGTCQRPLPKNLGHTCACAGCMQPQSVGEKRARLEESSKSYQAAFENLLSGEISGTLPALLEHIKVMDELLVLPWREYNNCQEAIKQCFSIMGNCHIVKT